MLRDERVLVRPGVRCGCDYAGVAEEVGGKMTKPFRKGYRIAGFIHDAISLEPKSGSFADYPIAKGHLQIKVPDNLSDEEAATPGISITTVSPKMPLPMEPAAERYPILIHSGSTAMGIFGTRSVKLSGSRVITTCSPRNSDYLRSLGAVIRALTGNAFTVVWDCTGTGAELCARAQRQPAKGAQTRHHRTPSATSSRGASPRLSDEFELTKVFWETSYGLVAGGLIRTVAPVVNKARAGLKDVLVDFEELRNGRVSAGMLVYAL
ncbi:hypothetical protein DL768_001660 [Monosporascus sp. mg162]|nr:hypothetical protein DL768_001660 [Monosporascus sp. mg162]